MVSRFLDCNVNLVQRYKWPKTVVACQIVCAQSLDPGMPLTVPRIWCLTLSSEETRQLSGVVEEEWVAQVVEVAQEDLRVVVPWVLQAWKWEEMLLQLRSASQDLKLVSLLAKEVRPLSSYKRRVVLRWLLFRMVLNKRMRSPSELVETTRKLRWRSSWCMILLPRKKHKQHSLVAEGEAEEALATEEAKAEGIGGTGEIETEIVMNMVVMTENALEVAEEDVVVSIMIGVAEEATEAQVAPWVVADLADLVAQGFLVVLEGLVVQAWEDLAAQEVLVVQWGVVDRWVAQWVVAVVVAVAEVDLTAN